MTRATKSAGEIASALSGAQKEALLLECVRKNGEIEIRIPWLVTGGCRCALQRKGILKDRQYSSQYTPFGLEVRSILMEKKP